MTAHRPWKHPRSLVLALVAGVVLIGCAGCQTFSLSAENFQKHQRGEAADRETGEIVAVIGTLGYCGAVIGEMVAAAFRK